MVFFSFLCFCPPIKAYGCVGDMLTVIALPLALGKGYTLS